MIKLRTAVWIAVFLATTALTSEIAFGAPGDSAETLAQTTVPTTSSLTGSAWYWRWGAMLGFTAAVVLVCFKNPKRSHDN